MKQSLFAHAIAKFFFGLLLVGALIFLPAGTWEYWQGWLLLGVLFIPMFCAGLVMLAKSPDLLRKRLNAKEEESEQKAVIVLSGLMFLASFLVAGFSRRFGWYLFPAWVSWAAAAVFLAAYALYAEVLRENAFLSRTIEVQEDQKVVDTGLYGIVRHPMYAVTLLLFLAMPLILGSPISFVILLCYPAIIVRRIRNEEDVLERGLPGYAEYKMRIRWRLIPGIW